MYPFAYRAVFLLQEDHLEQYDCDLLTPISKEGAFANTDEFKDFITEYMEEQDTVNMPDGFYEVLGMGVISFGSSPDTPNGPGESWSEIVPVEGTIRMYRLERTMLQNEWLNNFSDAELKDLFPQLSFSEHLLRSSDK